MLTSPKNPTIQHIVRLNARSRNRRESGQYVIEGVRLVEEALHAGAEPETVLYTDGLDERGQAVLDGFAAHGIELTPVTTRVMRAASDTKTPQGILAVLPLPAPELPENPTFVLIPDRIRDPGNMGTLIRTAAAAGADTVLVPPGSADPFAPKTLRAGMGAHFRIPVCTQGWGEIEAYTAPLKRWLADAAGDTLHTQADLAAPLALIIGGEAGGAGPEALALGPARLRISMPGGMESLNAAIAAGILLFEAVRQRKISQPPKD